MVTQILFFLLCIEQSLSNECFKHSFPLFLGGIKGETQFNSIDYSSTLNSLAIGGGTKD